MYVLHIPPFPCFNRIGTCATDSLPQCNLVAFWFFGAGQRRWRCLGRAGTGIIAGWGAAAGRRGSPCSVCAAADQVVLCVLTRNVTVSSWVSYLQTIADTLQYLSETYEVMEKKHRSIRHLIEQKRVTAQEAAARRDWSDVDKLHRALHKTIEEEIATYDTMAGHASGFRDSLVRLGVRRPPSPPPLLRTHQLTRRRG